MKFSTSKLLKSGLLILSLIAVLPVEATVAQNSSQTTTTQTNTAPAAQTTTNSQTTKQTTNTTTTQRTNPTQTTTTQTTSAIDPLWIMLGAVALLAILAIAFFATRGRSRPTEVVTERTTIIKKD